MHAIQTVHFRSAALGREVALQLYRPPGEGPFRSVYLLHGLGNSFESFAERTRLRSLAQKRRLLLVMPEAQQSWYCDDPREGGLPWERHLARELPDWIDANYPTIRDRRGRGVAGFSMGGYGAFLFAMRHAEQYAATFSVSGSMTFGHAYRPDRPERTPFMAAVAPPGGPYDLFRLAEQLVGPGPSVRLRFCVGLDDHLLGANREFHAHLESLGLDHTYEELPGDHSWHFVDAQLPKVLDFMEESLCEA